MTEYERKAYGDFRVTKDGRRFKRDERKAIERSKLSSWLINVEEGEHTCHVHPLGSTEVVTYWCGHTCQDPLCRKYLFVWLLTHPVAIYRKLFDRKSR